VTAALVSEATVEIGKCVAVSAATIAHQQSSTPVGSDEIADAALSQCAYLLADYESNDRALALAANPEGGVPFADQHAKESKRAMIQSVRHRATEVAQEERAKIAQQ
jgi:hypothetical protein